MALFKKRITENIVRRYASLFPEEMKRCISEARREAQESGEEWPEDSINQRAYRRATGRTLNRLGLSQDDWHDIIMMAHKIGISGFDGNIATSGNRFV